MTGLAPRITKRGRCGWIPTRRAASPMRTGASTITENLYAAGPALFPSIGSPNPMLTGIALSRRTGDRIMAPPPFAGRPGLRGPVRRHVARRLDHVDDQQPAGARMIPAAFRVRRGVLESRTGTDLGLLWLTRPTPARYVLRLQWMMTAPDDNSGVFIGFPDPTQRRLRQHRLCRRQLRLRDPDRRARAAGQRRRSTAPARSLRLQGARRCRPRRTRSASGTTTRSPSMGPTSRWR